MSCNQEIDIVMSSPDDLQNEEKAPVPQKELDKFIYKPLYS